MPRLAVTSCSRRIDARRAYDSKTPARARSTRETRPDVAARTIRKLHRWGGESPLSDGSSVQAGWSGPTHRFAQPRRTPASCSLVYSIPRRRSDGAARHDATRHERERTRFFFLFSPPCCTSLLLTRSRSSLLPLPSSPPRSPSFFPCPFRGTHGVRVSGARGLAPRGPIGDAGDLCR